MQERVEGVAVLSSCAYVAVDEDLMISDVRDPANPRNTGQNDMQRHTSDIFALAPMYNSYWRLGIACPAVYGYRIVQQRQSA